jgi:hypothetical protein
MVCLGACVRGGDERAAAAALQNLIDLAGSERSVSDADRKKEGGYINRSLLTLGTVIAKLSEGKGCAPHRRRHTDIHLNKHTNIHTSKSAYTQADRHTQPS